MPKPSLYKPEYCQVIRELMKTGAKDCQLYAALKISKATFYNWLNEFDDFKDAYDKGIADCEKYWEDEGLKLMIKGENRAFNYWIAFMNRKFGWANKNAPETTNNTQINIGINVLPKDKDGLLSFIQNKLTELEVFPQIEQKSEIVDAEFRESQE